MDRLGPCGRDLDLAVRHLLQLVEALILKLGKTGNTRNVAGRTEFDDGAVIGHVVLAVIVEFAIKPVEDDLCVFLGFFDSRTDRACGGRTDRKHHADSQAGGS